MTAEPPGGSEGSGGRALWGKLQSVGLVLVLIASFCAFGAVVNQHEPFHDWLFFRYAKAWGLVLYWCLGCLSTGWALVRWIAPRLPASEQWVLASATGIYTGHVALFVGGVAGLFRYPAFAVLLPAALLGAGARRSVPSLRRAWRHASFAQRRAMPACTASQRWLEMAMMAFGVLCLALLYLNILTPDNASFDAAYYHLGLAEQYQVRGGIAPAPEGWLVEALPQLASTLYAWPFIFPHNDLFDAMMACAHLEYVLFLATVFSLPVLVRRLVPRARVNCAWVAMFLFPGIIAYDAGLHSGNDHIAAFWAIPLWLASLRSWPRLATGPLMLFAVAAAGALLTKYQCASLVLGPAGALFLRAAWLAWKRPGAAWARGLAIGTAFGVLITTPHWLKNWVWFGDPLFPAFRNYLDVHPWNPRANELVEWNYRRLMPRPEGTLSEQLWQIFSGSFSYAFKPLTGFHGAWPIFGPLFTLSLGWLPFLRGARRIGWLAVATQIGIFFWYFFAYYERYLQPLVPWMAAVVAACIALIWQRGHLARGALAAVLGLELVWGGDVYFFPHFLLKDSPIRATAAWLGSGYRGDVAARERFRSPEREVGRALPADARVLLHEHHLRLGIARPVITDYTGFQTRFDYQDVGSARALYDLYRELGVTHVVWEHERSLGVDCLAGDLRFWQFVTHYTAPRQRFGILTVGALGEPPPERHDPEQVAYLSCNAAYERGLYPLAAMNAHTRDGRHIPTPTPAPSSSDELGAFIRDAAFVVTSPTCKGEGYYIPDAALDPFVRVAKRGAERLWVRRTP